jgi:hypothetical protein
MWRTLRAFAWLRWRIFVNSLEHTGSRDRVERFSLAIERLGPILLLLVMIPSMLALAGMSAYAGFALGRGESHPILFEAIRYMLLADLVLSVVGPILLPVADRTNPVRLLLLPIPRRTLYVSQISGAIADPWILLLIPIATALPIGLIAAGAVLPGLLALVAGALMFATLVGISALTTSLVHLLMRDRRRGELVALFFIVVLPLLSILPASFGSADRSQRRRERDGQTRLERGAHDGLPGWAVAGGTRAFHALPSELYTRSIRAALARDATPAIPLAGLVATVALLHGLGLAAFGRVLDSHASSGGRRAASATRAWGLVLPAVTPATSAVALAHLRLAFRTPRGRAILISPLLMFIVFAVLIRRSGGMDFGFTTMQNGLGLATFGSFVALLSVLPVAMNQFAVDGAGLTLQLLSPLTTRELLMGKAIGNGLISVPPALVCVALAWAMFRGGSAALWISLPLALIAIAIIVSPLAAIFSAVFPRLVDLNSIGQRSNAHGLSGLLGLLAFVAAGIPCLALTLVATRLIGNPALAPVFLLAWGAVAVGLARLLFIPAEKIFEKRRENLATLM